MQGIRDAKTSETLSLRQRPQCDGAGQLLSGLRHACEGAVGTRSRVGQSSVRNDAHWNPEGQVGVSQAGRTWKEIVGRGRNGEEIGHETFSTRWVTEGFVSMSR